MFNSIYHWLDTIGRTILVSYNKFIIIYFITLVSSYFIILSLSFIEVWRYYRTFFTTQLQRSFRSHLTPPISICIPCYNEAPVIVASIHALLALEYPQFELVLTNDGSTDNTLQTLTKAFKLHRVDQPLNQRIPTQPVKGIWRSNTHKKLVVIDKENGGRSDALNASINTAEYPLICCIDADSILEQRSLLTAVRPFLSEPDKTIGAGGIIRVANGCTIERGHVIAAGLPKSKLAMFQTIEYLRAFTAARTGWSLLNALLIISGAFGIFRKDIVIDIGGFATDSIGEDFELCVRLHKKMRQEKKDYKLAFVPDPVCWTEVPERVKDLGGQRDRWQRGLTDTLWRHKQMIFNPHYGSVGMLALPFFLVFEFFSVFIELSGYASITLLFILGIATLKYALLFFLLVILAGVCLSLSAMILEDIAFHRFGTWRAFARLITYCFLENFGYRQFIIYYRAKGLISYLRGNQAWGNIKRIGFEE